MQRLAEALQAADKLAAEEKVVGVADALDNVAEAAVKAEGATPTLAPGTQHVGRVMSAKVSLSVPCTTCLACSVITPCTLTYCKYTSAAIFPMHGSICSEMPAHLTQ